MLTETNREVRHQVCLTTRIALTQARYHPDARAYIDRRTSNGDSGKEAVRALKRRLSDVVFRAMTADINHQQAATTRPELVAA